MSQKRTKNEPQRTKNEPQRTIFRKSKYQCVCCEYITFKKANYTRHMASKKHFKNIALKESNQKKPECDEEKVIINESSDKLLREVIKEQQQQIKTLIDVVKEIKSTGSTTNNTNCNNTIINNHITVDVYLNDHCKDALNIRDFVNQIQVKLEDCVYPVSYTHLTLPTKA